MNKDYVKEIRELSLKELEQTEISILCIDGKSADNFYRRNITFLKGDKDYSEQQQIIMLTDCLIILEKRIKELEKTEICIDDFYWENITFLKGDKDYSEQQQIIMLIDCLTILEKRIKELEQKLENKETLDREQTEHL